MFGTNAYNRGSHVATASIAIGRQVRGLRPSKSARSNTGPEQLPTGRVWRVTATRCEGPIVDPFRWAPIILAIFKHDSSLNWRRFIYVIGTDSVFTL